MPPVSRKRKHLQYAREQKQQLASNRKRMVGASTSEKMHDTDRTVDNVGETMISLSGSGNKKSDSQFNSLAY
jgi:hypothetical protein